MSLALLSLGSNLGDRRGILQAALSAFGNSPGLRLLAVSRWHETPPIGGPGGQSNFLNGAALLETSLPPLELLARLQRIESHLGRRRNERWAARTLDLDLLLYDDVAFENPQLTLPHPRMAFRRFVLAPAVEVAPEMVHPLLGWTVRRLWEHLNSALPYVAIGGLPAIAASELMQAIALRMPARLVFAYEDMAEVNLDQQMRQLLDLQWPQPPPLTISAFWLEETLCLAAAAAEGMPAVRRSVPRPKLVICTAAAHAMVRRRTSDLGPWLRLSETDTASHLLEAVAALQAMQ